MSSFVSSSVPKEDDNLWKNIRKHLNFYRVHIIFFCITPLFFSGIFYASNGRYHISYIDSLFNCVSAMTVCGLATVNLSSLTGWQQAILFLQMCMGSPVVVSWVIVYIRKHYFAKKFEHIIEAATARKAAKAVVDAERTSVPWPNRIATLLRPGQGLSVVTEETRSERHSDEPKRGIIRRLRPDMIRRMDDAPKLINPSGWISEGGPPADGSLPMKTLPDAHSPQMADLNRHLSFVANSASRERPPLKIGRRTSSSDNPLSTRRARRLSDPGIPSRPSSPVSPPMQRFDTLAVGDKPPKPRGFPRTTTIEFAPNVARRRGRPEHVRSSDYTTSTGIEPIAEDLASIGRPSLGPHISLTTHVTNHTTHTHRSNRRPINRGFGGFPMPLEILSDMADRFFPKFKRRLTRTVTIPVTTSLISHRVGEAPAGTKAVPYISFDAVVGRNSRFHLLTHDQLEELGGVEYRALNALLWIVAGYHFGVQLLVFIVIAPYMSLSRWNGDFLPPNQVRPVPSTWFSIFQCVSSYTNTGTSLVDQSMLPFQRAYPMVVFMMFLILAGNTCFPIFLRFTIWILSKLVPMRSRANETLHFLLDHPRRCFIYLFPSHQTWFLLTIVLTLTLTDWVCFLILDIGNPAIEDIPVGIRVLAGLFQGIAVRAAGFGIVALAALAPAVKVLYVVMMYISVYPIALSVRSTNVYEEQSLGVFHDHDYDDEEGFQATGPRMTVWSRYLAMHARRQLAFDMWWLVTALFFICIIERHRITDDINYGWFNIFNIIFELVSAYGTVGLSLGIPDQNYSFSGSFRPLSKFIVCLVMLRGRHRGLPVAIDRAVLLPSEFEKPGDSEFVDETSQYQSQNGHGRQPSPYARDDRASNLADEGQY